MDSVVTPTIDLSKVEAINQKRTLAFINHWVVHTVAFLNQFSCVCEDKLLALDHKLRRADHTLQILEAKLKSVPGLDKIVGTPVASASTPATTTATPATPVTTTTSTTEAATSTQTPTANATQTAADTVPPPAPQPTTEGEGEDAVDSPAAAPVSAAPVSQDPRFAHYFRMMAVGVPKPAVAMKMAAEGLDPSVLDDPDAPAPPREGSGGDRDESDSSSVSSWSD